MVPEPSTARDGEHDSPDELTGTDAEAQRDDDQLLGSWDPGERDRVKMALVSVLAVGGLAAAGATVPQVAYVAGGVVALNGLFVDGVRQRVPHLRVVALGLTLAFLGGVAVLWPAWERTALGLGALFVAGTASRWLAHQSTN